MVAKFSSIMVVFFGLSVQENTDRYYDSSESTKECHRIAE